MSRNGSGVYSPSATGYPAVASTTIESAKYNAVIADIATALTLSIAANGETTITANIPLAGYKITGLGNASADTDALNRVTADARYALLSGATFTGTVTLNSADPTFIFTETDAATNEKQWRLVTSAGNFYLATSTDAGAEGAYPLSIVRTGTTVDSITFAGTTIAITGNATVSGNSTVGGTLTVGGVAVAPTTGTFTAYLRASVGGANLTSGTATWKKNNGVVTLFLPTLQYTGTATSLLIEVFPSEIRTSTDFLLPCFGTVDGSQSLIQVFFGSSRSYIELYGPSGGAIGSGSSNQRGLLATCLTYIV